MDPQNKVRLMAEVLAVLLCDLERRRPVATIHTGMFNPRLGSHPGWREMNDHGEVHMGHPQRGASPWLSPDMYFAGWIRGNIKMPNNINIITIAASTRLSLSKVNNQQQKSKKSNNNIEHI